ncbi:hypothetical protein [Actinomadura craniellae]|uniref:hypothetical protein n=1 Tax=Actinomadura craniellae TaxID=2231787 RepID=UPI000DCFF442|nr:hypothetical protein [Actinomadura craniellae]
MMKRLAATGAIAAAMGGVLLTASPALAGGDCHGCHHKHHNFHNHHENDFKWYDHEHKHEHINNHNTNVNRPVVVFDHEQENDDNGRYGGLLG